MADGDGRISGNEATKFFALSNLSRSQLKQLWTLADVKRQGFLGFPEFVTAMQVGSTFSYRFISFVVRFGLWLLNSNFFLVRKQLVSLAQAGQELNSDILKTQGKCVLSKSSSSITNYDGLEYDYIFKFIALIFLFLLVTVDKENIKPPVLEGLDALLAVS